MRRATNTIAADRGEDRQQHQRSVAERVAPTRCAVDAEHGLLHEVGEVVLGHVDPPFLGQLDEDPDEGGEPDHRPPAHAARVPTRPHHLVGDEEVLERVRERHEQPALLRDLERQHADEAVVPEESGDLDGDAVRPVPIHRQVGDGEVVDVERLVVVLVRVEVRSVSCCRIVWSAASTTSTTRIAGSGNRGMNSGTMNRTARMMTTTAVSALLPCTAARLGHDPISRVDAPLGRVSCAHGGAGAVHVDDVVARCEAFGGGDVGEGLVERAFDRSAEREVPHRPRTIRRSGGGDVR